MLMKNKGWKTFETVKDGIRLNVKWNMHDFVAYYKTGDVTLEYGRHIMAMCPMKYTKENLQKIFETENLYKSFKEAEDAVLELINSLKKKGFRVTKDKI